jgi:peptide deformylase
MPVRPIVVYPHDALLHPTKKVETFDDELATLVADMVETMHAEPGVGLAANQVADGRRLFVLDLTAGQEEGQVRVFVNPEILETSGRQSGEEGCLSFPGIFEVVPRPARIRFRAQTLEGETFEEVAEDFFARAVLHEVDHLDGKTFLDRMSPLKRGLVRRRIEKLKRSGEWPEEVTPVAGSAS